MSAAECLPDAIVRTLGENGTSAAAASVLALAEAEAAHLVGEMADAETASLSPMLDADEAQKAYASLSSMQFASRRLTVSIDALRRKVETLARQEADAVRDAERAAALKERDELARVIADEAPAMIRRLAAIVRDIDASDARLNAVGLVHESAEAKARGYSGNGQWIGGGLVTRFRNIHLPMFTGPGEAWRWDGGSGRMLYPALDEGA